MKPRGQAEVAGDFWNGQPILESQLDEQPVAPAEQGESRLRAWYRSASRTWSSGSRAAPSLIEARSTSAESRSTRRRRAAHSSSCVGESTARARSRPYWRRAPVVQADPLCDHHEPGSELAASVLGKCVKAPELVGAEMLKDARVAVHGGVVTASQGPADVQ